MDRYRDDHLGGGFFGMNTGGRYNPTTDSWIATSTTNAPSARHSHTAVWTGTEMIVWGGGYPGTNTWIATATSNVPDARFDHTAVWTGSEMIVWGGYDLASQPRRAHRHQHRLHHLVR